MQTTAKNKWNILDANRSSVHTYTSDENVFCDIDQGNEESVYHRKRIRNYNNIVIRKN